MACIDDHAHDFGYDVPGSPDHHGVTGAHILARYLIHVVQRSAAHRDSPHEYRLQAGDRGERAGASDLEVNRLQAR